jgi:hypothetical protein
MFLHPSLFKHMYKKVQCHFVTPGFFFAQQFICVCPASMPAARNLDWETFYGNQTRRGGKLLAVVAEGSTLRHGSRLLGLSDSTTQGEKRKLGLAVREYMGAHILAESTTQPMWRNGIVAGREWQAVRAARL